MPLEHPGLIIPYPPGPYRSRGYPRGGYIGVIPFRPVFIRKYIQWNRNHPAIKVYTGGRKKRFYAIHRGMGNA